MSRHEKSPTDVEKTGTGFSSGYDTTGMKSDEKNSASSQNQPQIQVDISSVSVGYNQGARVIPSFRDASGVLKSLEKALQDVALTDFSAVMLSASTDPLPFTTKPMTKLPPISLSLRLLSIATQLLQAVYIAIYLRLPALYHSRVLQVCRESGITNADINCMWTTLPARWTNNKTKTSADAAMNVSPELSHFLSTWETFVDDLLQEWRTLNVVSALMTSASLSLLSLSGSDAVSRTGCIFTFICSIISLLCGYLCILRFSSMRKPHKAAAWSTEAIDGNELIWWNPWIMLSAPAAWFSWAVILFLASIMAFTWRAAAPAVSAGLTTPELSARATIGIRIAVTCILGLGITCILLTLYTFATFGDSLDEKFHARVDSGIRVMRQQMEVPGIPSFLSGLKDFMASQAHMPGFTSLSFPALTTQGRSLFESLSYMNAGRRQAFPKVKLMDSRSTMPLSPLLPTHIEFRGQKHSPWTAFINDLQMVFNHPDNPEDSAFACVKHWNNIAFMPNGIEAILCLEYPLHSHSHSSGTAASRSEPVWAVYIMDAFQARLEGRQRLADIFGPLPDHLRKICLIDAIQPSISRLRGHPLGVMIERELPGVPQSHTRTRMPSQSQSQAQRYGGDSTPAPEGQVQRNVSFHTQAPPSQSQFDSAFALGRQRDRSGSDSIPQVSTAAGAADVGAGASVTRSGSVGQPRMSNVTDSRNRTKRADSTGRSSRAGRR